MQNPPKCLCAALPDLFFSSWMMCRSFLQRLPTCSSRGLSDLLAAETLHAARITNALLCPSCPAEGFSAGLLQAPGTAVGLFNMAQEGEWLQNRTENWSQAVISFHRCPPVTFSAEPHPFAFSTSKWGLPAFFKFCTNASVLFRMPSYSAVDCQWDESPSRLCVLQPQPQSANRPDRRKA
uniref:uncharacterized protein isoform X2 n=1 Tax=Lonchura striata TaxID=40157 RepID=UPI000B4DE0F6|nr:uncharacterized protein LOC110470766 isoform X2 [Lonchura striata domestica]